MKVGEGGRNEGKKIFHSRFRVFISGWVGRFPVLGQTGRNRFGKKPQKRGVFFHSIDGFEIVFGVTKPRSRRREQVLSGCPGELIIQWTFYRSACALEKMGINPITFAEKIML